MTHPVEDLLGPLPELVITIEAVKEVDGVKTVTGTPEPTPPEAAASESNWWGRKGAAAAVEVDGNGEVK